MSKQDVLILTLLITANIVFFIMPATIIIRRMGFSGWWMLLLVVPFAPVVGLWILALADWPALSANRS